MMPITPELLDELLKDYKSPDDMFCNDGLLQQLTKAVVERALQGELTHHLGYEKHDPAGKNTGNSRNGKSSKTIDRKSTRLNSSHSQISYAVFCLKKKNNTNEVINIFNVVDN